MARKCPGGVVLIRQLLGNCSSSSSPCAGFLHQRRPVLFNSSIQASTLNSIPIPNTGTPIIPYDSLHSRTHLHFLQYRRCHFVPDPDDSSYDSENDVDYSQLDLNSLVPKDEPCPSNLVIMYHPPYYYENLKKVQDERLSAVFYFTTPYCWPSRKWNLKPIFYKLCEQYPQIPIYQVEMDQNGYASTLHSIKIYSSPTFHFYVNGEMVDELKSASGVRLKKTLASIYNSRRVRKKRATLRAKKEDEGLGPCDGAVEVAECKLPAASLFKVMEAVESLPRVPEDHDLWWFARGLFLSQEKRERFSEIHPDLKLKWLKKESAGEQDGSYHHVVCCD